MDGIGAAPATAKGSSMQPTRAMTTVSLPGANGSIDPAVQRLRRRIIPVYSDIIVTEELPEGLAERVFPTNRHGNDILRIRSRYRLTPECRRLLFGGRGRFGAASARQNARSLHALMVERLPDFRGVRVEDAWSGPGSMKAGGAPAPRTCPSASRSRGASPQTA